MSSTDPGSPAQNGTSSRKRPRTTQRAPLSCLECTRRKIRCDKNQPCSACIERNKANTCRREAVVVRGSVVQDEVNANESLVQSLGVALADVKRRLAVVEEKLQERQDGEVTHDGQYALAENGIWSRPHSPPNEHNARLDSGRLPGAMEEATLGIGESLRWKGSSLLTRGRDSTETSHESRWYGAKSLQSCLSTLPSRLESQALVQYYFDEISWTCTALHGPSFISEHEAFWDDLAQGNTHDTVWVALLFSILCVSTLLIEEQDALNRGVTIDVSRARGNTWFDAAIATLLRCHYMEEPTLISCQVLQVLGPAFHLTCNTRLHQTFTSIERSHCRAINLHLLGNRSQDNPNTTLRKEIGRRVWWNEVEGDWLFIPYHRFSNFSPLSFHTSMPELCDDGELRSSKSSTSLEYRITCYKASKILYDLYSPLGLGRMPDYDRVLQADDALQSLQRKVPDKLRWSKQYRNVDNKVLETQRKILSMTLAYRSYQIHRLFFVRSLTGNFLVTREACVTASNTILEIIESGLPSRFYLLWNITVTMVAAGIVLGLQLLAAGEKLSTGDQTEQLRMEALIKRLESLHDESGIAARGASLLQRLLDLRLTTVGDNATLDFTREQILDFIQPTMRNEASGAVENVSLPQLLSQHTNFDLFGGDIGNPTLTDQWQTTASLPDLYHADFDFMRLFDSVDGNV